MILPIGASAAVAAHRWKREEQEHYVEPEWCSQRLFELEKFEGSIWDPACGIGRIPIAAIAAGYSAAGTDIVDRGYGNAFDVRDFLTCTYEWDNIVSNPPFEIFREFATTALRVARHKVALIWLVRTLPAARWIQDTPLSRIHLLTPRPSMPPGHVIARGEKPGGGKQDFCWLVWDKTHEGPPAVTWLHRDGNLRAA